MMFKCYLSTAIPKSLCDAPAEYDCWPTHPQHAYDDHDLVCLVHLPNLLKRECIVAPVVEVTNGL